MTSPGYVAVLILHVLSAVIGFGALAMTGLFAQRVRARRDPFGDESLRSFFRPGPNLAAMAIVGVPVFGALLLVLGPADQPSRAFPWIGLCCWALAAALAAAVVWPCERALQQLFSTRDSPDLARRLAARAERAVAVIVVCGLVGLAVMVAQP